MKEELKARVNKSLPDGPSLHPMLPSSLNSSVTVTNGRPCNLKIRYLEQQRDQIIKAISKTHKKEETIDAGDDAPEMKEIRTWRQQGKRRKLLKKQKMEEKIKCKREKRREREDQEEAAKDDEKKAGFFLRIVTGLFEGYGDLNMAVL
ncbi:trichohyalin-like protein [Lates japonicus]|uniref:Trichohyalin-like protein n=1 Tax=Lates japonicus TaxID=270547 RepID=A0AAD3NH25_LATJO|nr:trichohyalin-like protein [Lates japonicus]